MVGGNQQRDWYPDTNAKFCRVRVRQCGSKVSKVSKIRSWENDDRARDREHKL